MGYEKIPHDKNKSIKLSYSDIEAVHWLFHVEKWTKPQIASRFNVTYTCIDYHLMTDEQKKERNKKCHEVNQRRCIYDKVYKKHLQDNNNKWSNQNKRTRSDFNSFRNEMSKKQRDEENAKTWAHDYRIKHLDIITAKLKVYNAKPEVKSHRHIKNLERYKRIKNDPILHEKFKQIHMMQHLERMERKKRDPYFNL